MSRLTDMAEQITQALNYIQPTETDVPELEERRKAIRRSLMDTRELLRAASAETVGTEWPTHSDPCLSAYGRNHNAEVGAARLAIADLKAERDAKQQAIDEAFAVLDAGHGILACREAAHILRPHATKANHSETPKSSPRPQCPPNVTIKQGEPPLRDAVFGPGCSPHPLDANPVGSEGAPQVSPVGNDDTRELVARLADIMRCGFLWTERRERDLAAIIAAARRGVGA